MLEPAQYELLDFGNGRRLERFVGKVLDRPCPAAAGRPPADRQLWPTAAARYDRTQGEQGSWSTKIDTSDWILHWRQNRFQLKPTDFGHVGVFVEQAANWQWLSERVTAAAGTAPPRVLNLFAYTGGSSLAAAAAGAEVVHVEAAKNVVSWARRNAELSGLAAAPIRWIVEDARKFVQRELKRGHQYDAVILDPPSYGHGPKGESWKIERDLLPLLADVGQLTRDHRQFLLLTCHSPGFGPPELQACLADAVFGSCQAGGSAARMQVATHDGRKLPCGVVARWP